jgi:hypothetical protein
MCRQPFKSLDMTRLMMGEAFAFRSVHGGGSVGLAGVPVSEAE